MNVRTWGSRGKKVLYDQRQQGGKVHPLGKGGMAPKEGSFKRGRKVECDSRKRNNRRINLTYTRKDVKAIEEGGRSGQILSILSINPLIRNGEKKNYQPW